LTPYVKKCDLWRISDGVTRRLALSRGRRDAIDAAAVP